MSEKNSRRYPPELKERACRLVYDWRKSRGRSNGGFNEIGHRPPAEHETLFYTQQPDPAEGPKTKLRTL